MRYRARFGPLDRQASYYQYVPFEVSSSWRSVTVELSYDHTRAVVDLGLFSPLGFRGWSGGERSSVSVTPAWATPGYLPGDLPEGEWSVLLGLYLVPDDGAEITVEVGGGEPLAPPPPAEAPPAPEVGALQRPPASPGHRWAAGDLHAHSEHSDGSLAVAGLAALARGGGLDYLAVTDHNTVSHFASLPEVSERYGIYLLPGQEVTTPDGHANCFGDVGWVDFRQSADAWAAQASGRGGLMSVNHPLAEPLGWRQPMSATVDCVELWHQTWDRRGTGAARFWASLGRPVPVGGSDFHRPAQADGSGAERAPGRPTTWVEVPDDGAAPQPGDILEALRRGRVAISCAPLGPVVVRQDGELVVTGGEGAVLVVLEELGAPAGPAPGERAAPQMPASESLERLGPSWAVTGDRWRLPGRPGLAVLLDPAGRALALCP
ncbi:MAG: CehA/McbA family metallohydrolase [Acidimicrobiales bacterium]